MRRPARAFVPRDPSTAEAVKVSPPGLPLLRGIRWGDEPATLLLHAPGGDLDDWQDLPLLLARRTGFGAVALDLPGHGLSDDAGRRERGAQRLAEVIRTLAVAGESSRVRAIVAAGETALALLAVAPTLDLAGIVCLSPAAPGSGSNPVARSPKVPKLFLAWSGDGNEITRTRALATEAGGWTIVSGFAGPGPGAALLDGPWGDQARDQIAAFLQECLLRS